MSIALNDGSSIPWLGFGTGTAFFGQDATSAVRAAIDGGVTHLDGAQMYKNEATMGTAITESRVPRDSLYIVTKLHTLSESETVKDSLVKSLKKLQVDHVDLFLVHSPLPHDLKKVWKEMEQVQKEGLTTSIGVSNFRVPHLKTILEVATIIPAVNQIEFHPYVIDDAAPIVAFGKEQGIVTAAYGPLTTVARAAGGPTDAVVESIRQRLETARGSSVTAAQVLLKWVNQRGIVAVTTTSKQARIQEYLDAINIPELSEEELLAIEKSGAGQNQRFRMKPIFD